MFGFRWRVVLPDDRWGNSSGRVWLKFPFPPLGFLFVYRRLPVSLSPTHLVSYNLQTIGTCGRARQRAKIVEIRPETRFVRKGARLFVDGAAFCALEDERTAHHLVLLLNGMKNEVPSVREESIRAFWRDRFDCTRAKRWIRAILAESRVMRTVCSIAFLVLFCLLPWVAVWIDFGMSILFGLAVMPIASGMIGWLYARCRRRNRPAFRNDFWSDLVKMVLCPPTALRAADLVMERLSAGLEALPLAKLLLRGDARKDFLCAYLDDLRAPDIPSNLDPVVRETCLWQNRTILETITPRFCRQDGHCPMGRKR